ncbi:hypothetical protein BYT27DRAFT_7205632 [Phlegmacium glaucopus]|nr:hypothetical protein BYT27DRAFT_7205632 [Phlegmacium glaucopus]
MDQSGCNVMSQGLEKKKERSREGFYFFSLPGLRFVPYLRPPTSERLARKLWVSLKVCFGYERARGWDPYRWYEATLPIIKGLDLQGSGSKHSPRN